MSKFDIFLYMIKAMLTSTFGTTLEKLGYSYFSTYSDPQGPDNDLEVAPFGRLALNANQRSILVGHRFRVVSDGGTIQERNRVRLQRITPPQKICEVSLSQVSAFRFVRAK